jgi:abortive infection bacteriophage resistance protein
MWRVFYCPDSGGEAGVNYSKPALSFEQQADQLLSRSFVADRALLIETLSRVSYYRLSMMLMSAPPPRVLGSRFPHYPKP